MMPCMIVSLLYKVTRKLLTVPSVLLRRGTAKDAELLVLRHENAVLRRQLTGPVRYEPADRFWFAVLSGLIPRRHWLKIFLVTRGHGPPDRGLDGAAGAESHRRPGHTHRVPALLA